jgi:exodeoxyribonuclease V gamma subunit
MLRVVRSNRADALLGALIEALPPLDPFAPTPIVVGGHLVARWLQRELACARGIAVGLDLVTFDRFVEQTWGDASLLPLDRGQLAAAIASELADAETLAELPPVAAYLGDTAKAERAATRRVQLAERLAELAGQYAATRPDWMVAFSAGLVPDELSANTTARWQAALISRALARVEQRTAKRTVPAALLPWARRHSGLDTPQRTPEVFVFGVSYFARAQLDALSDLATTTAVTVCLLDPCEPLWDDAPGRGRDRTGDDPPLLSLWGRAVRDSLGALVERSGGNVEGAFVNGPRRNARAALLADLCARESVDAPGARPASGRELADAGVLVLACPNARRELEAVAADVRARLDDDATLAAWDVVVWIAGDANRYLALTPSAFEAVSVPCHLVDAPLDEPGRIGEAVLGLLELPTSSLRRGDLLHVMTHPAVIAGHPHVDADDWVRWTDRLGIAHGADAESRAGTYLERHAEHFHWDQGVRRLALGAFMTGGRGALVDGIELAPEDVRVDQQASAATYALLVRSLCADARWLAGHAATLTEWAAIFVGVVDTYLACAEPARELERVRGTLAAIARVDLDGRRVGFSEARELARRRLRGTRADRGETLASGVMIAPMRPMRAIPFRVAYVVGLDEGIVPASDRRGSLDVRDTARPGEVSPRDRDRDAFLEVVLGARDTLVLSYVAQEAKSGQPLGPSSLVLELADALTPYLGVGSSRDTLAAITRRVPLHRAAEASAHERWAASVRDALHAQLRARDLPIPDEDELVDLIADGALPALRDQLGLPWTTDAPASPKPPRTLSLATLRAFLESPVQAWGRATLGLDDDDDRDEVLERSNEPFQLDRPLRASLLRDTLAAELRELGPHHSTAMLPGPETHGVTEYDARARELELRGQFPVGVFGEVERAVDQRLLASWRESLAGVHAAPVRLAFGRAHSDDADLVPAFVLELASDRRIELVGQTELLARDGGRWMSIIPIVGKLESRSRYHLRGAFDHVVLAASGRALDGHVHVIVDREGRLARVEHAAWSVADARAYLADLASDLLDGAHGYLLPLDALARALEGKPPARPDSERALGFGPLQRADGLDLPCELAAIARRRLLPLVARMRGDHGFAIGASP